jgi:hypothetical protein
VPLTVTVADEPAGPVPVPAIVFRRPGLIERAWRQRGVRQLALAASLAVVAAGGIWLAIVTISGLPSASSRTLARSEAPPVATDPEVVAPIAVEAPQPDSLADSSTDPLPPATPAADAPAVVAADTEPAPGDGASDTPARLSPAEALALARESRLAIRIRAADADAVARAVQRIAERPTGQVRWRAVEPGEAAPILVAMIHEPAHAPAPGPVAPAPAPTIAGDGNSPPPPPPPPPAAELVRARPDLRVLYTVELSETEAELGALAEALTGRGRTAEFVALDQALPRVPSLEPGAVLWWTRPPAQWVRRTTVPIVLERAGQ